MVNLLLEEVGKALSKNLSVLQSVSEVLGKGTLAGAKKPDTQTPTLSWGSAGASATALRRVAYWSRMLSVATYSVISEYTECSSLWST